MLGVETVVRAPRDVARRTNCYRCNANGLEFISDPATSTLRAVPVHNFIGVGGSTPAISRRTRCRLRIALADDHQSTAISASSRAQANIGRSWRPHLPATPIRQPDFSPATIRPRPGWWRRSDAKRTNRAAAIRETWPRTERRSERSAATKRDGRAILAGAGGIEPCDNPLPHKDFSIPACRFDSILDSKATALVEMTRRRGGLHRGQGLESERRSRPSIIHHFANFCGSNAGSFEVRHARRQLPAESALMSAAR